MCSVHFKPEDYKWTPQRKTLKPSAVPSVFSMCKGWERFEQKTTARKSPMKRQFTEDQGSSRKKKYDENLPNNSPPQSTSPSPSSEEIDEKDKKIRELHAALQAKDQHIARQAVQIKYQQEIITEQSKQLQIERWGIARFSYNSDDIRFYTGLLSYQMILVFFNAIKPSATNLQSAYYVPSKEKSLSLRGRPRQMQLIDELFMTLMRLRRGFPERDLAVRFNISEQTVSGKIITWINYLYIVLGSIPVWFSRETIKSKMPRCFRSMFPTTRVVIDCTEIPTEYASSLVLNSQLYSNYKSRPTFKGVVTFISHLFTGCISDIVITKLCGLIDLLEPGDMIMADKGFRISKLLEGKDVQLNLPPFLGQMASLHQRKSHTLKK